MAAFRAAAAVRGALLALVSSFGCAGASGVASTPSENAAWSDAAPSPVPPPRPGILGCVESRELKDFVLALDAQRQAARRGALAALGSTFEERPGAFRSGTAAGQPSFLDQTYEAQGQRFAVAAELAPHVAPRAALARQGAVLRRIDERPRAHAVDVLVCGVERCSRPVTSARVPVRPLVIELAPGEAWGGTLRLDYDYWWARVRYPRREPCAPLQNRSADEN